MVSAFGLKNTSQIKLWGSENIHTSPKDGFLLWTRTPPEIPV